MIKEIKLHAKKNPVYLLELGLCLLFTISIIVTVLTFSILDL